MGGVPFAYYSRLTAGQKRIYRASDAVVAVELPDAAGLRPLVGELERALAAGKRSTVERHAHDLSNRICRQLGAPPVQVKVLAARPTRSYGELHGLYDPEPQPPRLTVWMRTAARKQVVAFRSFLRTVIHELLHHLDYELFELEDSYHTEGFFKRESSVARQLLGEPPGEVAGPG